jgi:6-phosphogluconolactonase (cycloisomerase 2 family)
MSHTAPMNGFQAASNTRNLTMKISKGLVVRAGLGVLVGAVLASAAHANGNEERSVYVMSNNADANEIYVYARTDYGTLIPRGHVRTGGRGSGGKVDPLTSQGSLTLTSDGRRLLAVNAGSGTLSVLEIEGSALHLIEQVSAGGSEPVAVAQGGDLIYVLNNAGTSNVVGFRLRGDHLAQIAGSRQFLSGNNVTATSIKFSADGRSLLVVERGPNKIDGFGVNADGTLTARTVNAASPGVFALSVAPNGTVVTSETGTGAPNGSTVSSFQVSAGGVLAPVSQAVPALANANCWNAITPDGRYVYTSNAASGSISGYAIGADGSLTPLPGTVVGYNPAGSANLDIAISSDGKFVYTLNAASGAVGEFAINQATGALTALGVTSGLPAAAGLNGIAAN